MSKTVARISKSVSRLRVVASGKRAPVEPAVTGFDLEAGDLQQRPPLVGREPRKRHRRLARFSANRQGKRPSLLVPDGAFEDAGFTLEPAVVRLRDVLRAWSEHVEDEAAARHEQLADSGERPAAILVGVEVKERAERADHERDAFPHRRLEEV